MHDNETDNIQIEAARLRNEYMKGWRERNKDKVKKANRLYWQRKAERRRNAGK